MSPVLCVVYEECYPTTCFTGNNQLITLSFAGCVFTDRVESSPIWLENTSTCTRQKLFGLFIMRTRQQSRVESNLTRKYEYVYATETIWLIYNAHTPAESSRVQSSPVPRVLPSQESLCRMFAFSSVGLQLPGLTAAVFRREMNVERSIVVVNTLRMGSFKLFKCPLPGFLTILTL